MRATSQKKNCFLERRGRRAARGAFLSILFLLFLLGSFACGGPAGGGNPGQSDSGSPGIPELTDEIIRERINEAWVREVPDETGAAPPITWRFFQSEPKEIKVIEKKVEGTRASVVLDIKASSSPRSREQRQLAGQIRIDWELNAGWVLRQWEIVETENISMKYKNLPKPPAQDPNR
jgi:hypothetical protein